MSFFYEGRGKNYGVHHFIVSCTGPLEESLASNLGISVEESDFLLKLGAIYLNKKRLIPPLTTVHTIIKSGDYLRIHSQPRRFQKNLLNWPDSLVFENQDFLVINKPSGIPVHPTVDNSCENLKSLLDEKMKAEVFVTHRLDIPTSGLIVYAKTKEFQKKFNFYLKNRQIQKLYRCLVHKKYEGPLILKHYMEPSPRAPKRLSKEPIKDWIFCELHIQRQELTKEGNSILTIELITGRTHQIRSQLSYEGYPIVGDQLYGSSVLLGDGSFEQIALQACSIVFLSDSQNYSFQI